MSKTISLSAEETLDILNKNYLDTNDIAKVASVGRDKAREIKRDIENKLIEEGYTLTPKVPTDKVVEYLKINVNYLKKIAK